MSLFLKYLSVFGMAMLPVIELRGSVPCGVTQGLPLPAVLAVSIVGNMIPVPFIILFIRPIFNWMKKKSKWMASVVGKLEERAANKHDLIVKYQLLGLFILVAIPLPGTGAWTGALVAALFDLRLKNAVPVILAGVVAAGIIMSIVSYGAGFMLTLLAKKIAGILVPIVSGALALP